ncbi:MAG: lipase family protein [Planctomycetes bacterium]|nr:lipase family protein [Planctomycetota bacterium]
MIIDPLGYEAWLSAKVCELSYLDFSSRAFMDGMTALGFSTIQTVDNAGVQALAAVNERIVIVCFRGTDSLADWMADATAEKTTFVNRKLQVHTGFIRTLMVVERDINEFIRREYKSSKQLIITGHSLGAAMAVLYAMRWWQDLIGAVITFGCPRVGNQAFADKFNRVHGGHSLRFVNNNDVVTRVPFKWMDFSHVFHQTYFDRKGNIHASYRRWKAWKFFDSVLGYFRVLRQLKIGDGIRDHSIHDYRRLIEKNQRTQHG